MKNKIITALILTILIIMAILSIGPITDQLAQFLKQDPKVVINPPNAYYRDINFKYVQQSEDFIPYSRQDLKNIFYSILNNGYETFTFYCATEYEKCVEDVLDITSQETNILPHINNFVHPFNGFSGFDLSYTEAGEITVSVTKAYNNEDIYVLNNEIDKIMNNLIKPEMDDEEKILAIHDHIINITRYDLKFDPKQPALSPFRSNRAMGPLLQGYAVCSGYTDAMAIFLNLFDIPNFKIATEGDEDEAGHIWNAVYVDGKWLHLDLTWNDPVNLNNPEQQTLIHKFFLINTNTLRSLNINEHDFDLTIYQEMAI